MYKEEKTLKEFNQNETSDIHTMEPDADGFIPPGPVTGINKQKRTGDEADNIALITPTKTKKGTVSESSVQEYSNYLGANEHSSITDVVKEMGQGLKLSCAEWAQLFDDSQQFETFCPTRLDKMLKEAKALEKYLIQQKEELRDRLKSISQTLEIIL